MKKKIIAIVLGVTMIFTLAGCSKKIDVSKMTPDDYEPQFFEFEKGNVNEDKLPDDTFFIIKETKKSVRYYPLYSACETTVTEQEEFATGADPSRVIWVNYNIDEGLIPTMNKDDTLIYKSQTLIPNIYAMEKFYDHGYTFGVAGLKPDVSGKCKYESINSDSGSGSGIVQTTSDAAGFDSLEAESIYFVSVGDTYVTSDTLNQPGAISGLELMKQYKCDIREGTKKNDVSLTANIRLFSSAENYMFSDFEFITPYIAKINLPDYMTTGYYCANAAGFFKYDKDGSKDNNETIYTYDEYGDLNGAMVDGVLKKFDDNGFIVDYEEIKEGDEYSNEDRPPVVARLKNSNGYFGEEYYISFISKPKTNGKGQYFNIDASNMDGTDSVQLRIYSKSKTLKDIKVGNSYNIEFEYIKSDQYDDGFGIIKHCELNTKNAKQPPTEDPVSLSDNEDKDNKNEKSESLDFSSVDTTNLDAAREIYNSLSDDQKDELSSISSTDTDGIKAFYDELSDDQKRKILDLMLES